VNFTIVQFDVTFRTIWSYQSIAYLK